MSCRFTGTKPVCLQEWSRPKSSRDDRPSTSRPRCGFLAACLGRLTETGDGEAGPDGPADILDPERYLDAVRTVGIAMNTEPRRLRLADAGGRTLELPGRTRRGRRPSAWYAG